MSSAFVLVVCVAWRWTEVLHNLSDFKSCFTQILFLVIFEWFALFDHLCDHRAWITQILFFFHLCDLFPQIAWVMRGDRSLEFQIDRSFFRISCLPPVHIVWKLKKMYFLNRVSKLNFDCTTMFLTTNP